MSTSEIVLVVVFALVTGGGTYHLIRAIRRNSEMRVKNMLYAKEAIKTSFNALPEFAIAYNGVSGMYRVMERNRTPYAYESYGTHYAASLSGIEHKTLQEAQDEVDTFFAVRAVNRGWGAATLFSPTTREVIGKENPPSKN